MNPCPSCGAQVTPGQAICQNCGKPLQQAAARPMQRTMLGIPQLAGIQPGTSPGPAAPATPAQPAPGQVTAVPLSGSKTLMGMSAPMLSSLAGTAANPAGTANPPGSATAPGTAPAVSPKRTLIGTAPVALQGLAHGAGMEQKVSPHLGAGTQVGGTSPVAATVGTPGALSKQQTVMGVARPGIAPLHPGEAKPALAPLDPSLGEIIDSSPPSAPPDATPWRVPTSALVLVGVCSAMVFGAVVFSILYDAPKPLSATAGVDEKDRDVLAIVCDNCGEGTKATLGGTTITLNNGGGVLPLQEPLTLGNNVFKLGLERPGMGRDEVVNLVVPVHYRVHADYGGLNDDPSEFAAVFQVRPGMKVSVADEEIELDETGRGSYAIDLSKRLQGIDPNERSVSEVVSYSMTSEQGNVDKGIVKLQASVVPLWLESPGLRTVLEGDRFKLAGRTAKGGTVTVEGQPIVVDAEGHFDQMMSVDAVGETSIVIRAQAPDKAPRWEQIKIKRVEDLKKEADLFRQTGTDQYGSYAQNIETKIGMAVVADGVVEQSALDGQTTTILLDVQNGCKQGPCLVRLVNGGALELKPHAKLSAFGRISRAVDGTRPGKTIPEIQVEFLLNQP